MKTFLSIACSTRLRFGSRATGTPMGRAEPPAPAGLFSRLVRPLVTAFLLAATLPAARGDLPGIVGSDDRVAIDPTAWPWTAVGRVNRTGDGYCTGTLVAPALVLTAAHCLYHAGSGRPVALDHLHFLAGYRRGEQLAHATVRGVVLSESFRFDDPVGAESISADWALLVLDRPLTVQPIPVRALAPGEIEATQAGTLRLMRAGYGADRPHLPSLHDRCRIASRLTDGWALLHDCDATRGDSGSPLLIETTAGVSLVGVTTGATRIDGKDTGVAVGAEAFLARIAVSR
jgi:protease YdgD